MLGAYFGDSFSISVVIVLLMLVGAVALISRWKWSYYTALACDALVVAIFGYEVTDEYCIYTLAPQSILLLWPYLISGICVSLSLSRRTLRNFILVSVLMLIIGIAAAPLHYWWRVRQMRSIIREARVYSYELPHLASPDTHSNNSSNPIAFTTSPFSTHPRRAVATPYRTSPSCHAACASESIAIRAPSSTALLA